MKKKKIVEVKFLMGGDPCKPKKIIRLSKEQGESMMERLEELRKEGKVLFSERIQSMTEHEYYDHEIQRNIEIENYEECARLLKLKNETPHSEDKTRTISEIL